MLTANETEALEKSAEANDGRCDKCHQTIKIYRYKISKAHALFLRAMADEVRNSSINDIDISTIGLAYSVRSQVTKMRQHGLIARVKNEKGAQIPRRWLITHKGWDFLNGKPIASKVVVFNNQVLGHDDGLTTIYSVLGEKFDSMAPKYEEAPVTKAEARTYENVREPQKYMVVKAIYNGLYTDYENGRKYELQIKKLVVGQPVVVIGIDRKPVKLEYKDIASFQKTWRAV